GSVRGHGSEVTRRRGASVRIPIRALHRQRMPDRETFPKRVGPGSRRGPREGPSGTSSHRRKRWAPATQTLLLAASGGVVRATEEWCWHAQPTAEPQRPTRETLPQGGRARE